MTAEKLSDALSYLDDDIIEEAESYRNGKRRRKRILVSVIAAAACLCILFVGVHSLMNSQLFIGPDRGNVFTSGGTEIKHGGSGVAGYSGISSAATAGESFWYYAQILRWADDGFYAVITGSEVDGGDLQKGTKVKVCFEDELIVIKNVDELAQQYIFECTPDESDFVSGSVVKVELSRVEKLSDDSDAEYILWTGAFGDIASFQK